MPEGMAVAVLFLADIGAHLIASRMPASMGIPPAQFLLLISDAYPGKLRYEA